VTTGYSGKPLVTKLGIKSGHRVHVAGAPADFALDGLPQDVALLGGSAGSLDVILLFVKDQKSLRAAFPRQSGRLTQAGMLWVAWPKKTSKVPTDLTEDRIRDIVLPTGYVDVKVCAVDETWSGLKLVKRKELRDSRH
jgi:hypothetical protein